MPAPRPLPGDFRGRSTRDGWLGAGSRNTATRWQSARLAAVTVVAGRSPRGAANGGCRAFLW